MSKKPEPKPKLLPKPTPSERSPLKEAFADDKHFENHIAASKKEAELLSKLKPQEGVNIWQCHICGGETDLPQCPIDGNTAP